MCVFSFDLKYVKPAPCDDINFRFQFCNEVVYPTDHDIIFFRVFRFKKMFFSNPHFYESGGNPDKLFVYISTC